MIETEKAEAEYHRQMAAQLEQEEQAEKRRHKEQLIDDLVSPKEVVIGDLNAEEYMYFEARWHVYASMNGVSFGWDIRLSSAYYLRH